MNTDMNVYNTDMSRYLDIREQRKVLQVASNNFGEHHPQMLEPNTYSDMNAVYADLFRYHRDIGEERCEMQEANTLSDMHGVYAHLCPHRELDEQRRKMLTRSNLFNKALDAIHSIVGCVALVAEEEDNATMNTNMNINMNTARTTNTNDNHPLTNHNRMDNNFRSSSPVLSSSSSVDFQQHLQQLQQQQQMKHELDQLQKRQQELVQMMGTNTTTMAQKNNSPYAPMSMSMSQNQQGQEQDQQQQHQLQSLTAIATATITPPITQKKTVNLGRTNFTLNLTEKEKRTRTVDNNNTVPKELDILIGRGRGVDNHTGNIYYRQVVESFRKQYEALSNKGGKTKFIFDVVDIIYENGHQFVKRVKDPNLRTGCATWVPVDRDVARDKVSNSFRNAKRLQAASASASASTSTNNKYNSRTRTKQHAL